ncbi:MAG: hypothetical protein ACLTQI_06905 [Slackia sp.]
MLWLGLEHTGVMNVSCCCSTPDLVDMDAIDGELYTGLPAELPGRRLPIADYAAFGLSVSPGRLFARKGRHLA